MPDVERVPGVYRAISVQMDCLEQYPSQLHRRAVHSSLVPLHECRAHLPEEGTVRFSFR